LSTQTVYVVPDTPLLKFSVVYPWARIVPLADFKVTYIPVNRTPRRLTDLTLIVIGEPGVEAVVVLEAVVVVVEVVVEVAVVEEEVVELDVGESKSARVATVWVNEELSVEYGFNPLRLSIYM
jgi:hypothetical protein